MNWRGGIGGSTSLPSALISYGVAGQPYKPMRPWTQTSLTTHGKYDFDLCCSESKGKHSIWLAQWECVSNCMVASSSDNCHLTVTFKSDFSVFLRNGAWMACSPRELTIHSTCFPFE